MLLSSCEGRDFNHYYGDYPECHTMALYNIPNTVGGFEAYCELIEEDSYGRKLYIYGGDIYSTWYDENEDSYTCVFACLISQSTDDIAVYYYPKKCVIKFEYVSEWSISYLWNHMNISEIILNCFSQEAIEQFKNDNDWDRELQKERFVEQYITREGRRNQADRLTATPTTTTVVQNSLTPSTTNVPQSME
ncbi:MAG: hypothetical protein IJX47_04060 [Clostridia bacterium]|nr:hypothetical protein [Clostridia bacterium]